MSHFRRTLKAYSGALVAGLGALALQRLTGEPLDPDTMQAFKEGALEVLWSLVLAGGAWFGVYTPANKV